MLSINSKCQNKSLLRHRITITSPSVKSLVSEVDKQVIGYVPFSVTFLKSDANISGYILAPLAVFPKYQKQ